VGQPPNRCLVLAFDERAEAAGERFLKEWRNKLKETGHSLSAGDEANFRHAGKVVGAFRYVAPTAILEMT
jgi:hypothetical protein